MLPNVYHVMSEEIHICNLFISQVVRFTWGGLYFEIS